MVEPIGLVGTLVGIIQVSIKLVSVCYDYRIGVRDAPQDISRILDEVGSVGNIAQRLLKNVEADDGWALPSLQAMAGSDGPLWRFLAELQDLNASLKLGKSSRFKRALSFKRALAWPIKRADAERRLQVIATIKSSRALAKLNCCRTP